MIKVIEPCGHQRNSMRARSCAFGLNVAPCCWCCCSSCLSNKTPPRFRLHYCCQCSSFDRQFQSDDGFRTIWGGNSLVAPNPRTLNPAATLEKMKGSDGWHLGLFLSGRQGPKYNTFRSWLGTSLPKSHSHVIFNGTPTNHVTTCGTCKDKKFTLFIVVVIYTDYPNRCVQLFGVTQDSGLLLRSSIFTNKSSIGYLDVKKPKWLCLVKYYISIK